MKIGGNGYEINKYISETALNPGKEQTEKTSTQSNVPAEPTGDVIVHLSDTSKEVQKAREVIESEPDVRSDEVRAIREEIEQGTYEVDGDKTAEKMVGYFIDELV